MYIELSDKYRLASDKYQWMIQRKSNSRDKDTGEPIIKWTGFSFHSSIKHAINHHAEFLLRTSDATTLDEALQEMQNIIAKLTKHLSPDYEIIKK